MAKISNDIRRLLRRGVRIIVDPKYAYVWREDDVIRIYKPDRWRVIYIVPDDDVICEQRPRKGVVFKVTGNGVYAFAKVKRCLDIWLD